MKNFDVVIVGNGAIGFSVAFSLIQADPQLKIAVIGPQSQLGSASRAAGAMLGCFGEVTQATFSSTCNHAKLTLALQARKLWPTFINAINDYVADPFKVQSKNGTYIILNTTSGNIDNQNFDAIVHALDYYEEPYQSVDPADIPNLNPIPNHRPLRSIYIPNEGAIDPNQLLDGLQAALRQQGVDHIDSAVRELTISANSITGVVLDSGEKITGKQVVLCNGAYAQSLISPIERLKYRIPYLLSGIGHGLVFSFRQVPFFSSAVIRTPNRAGACGVHYVPRGQDSFYFGASNYLALEPTKRLRSRYLYYLLQYVTEQINQDIHDAEVEELTVGNRPVAIDTYPLVGETSIQGLWLLTGTYRDGLHMAPALSKIIVDRMLHADSRVENIFLPERAPLVVKSLEQSIEETVQHFMSTGYEHSMHLPRMGWDEMLYSLIKNRIMMIAEKLDISFGIPPEVFIMFNRASEQQLQFFKSYFKSVSSEFSQMPQLPVECTST